MAGPDSPAFVVSSFFPVLNHPTHLPRNYVRGNFTVPRTPTICGHTRCLKTSTAKGRCETHQPAPFEGARDRWNSSRPPGWGATRLKVIKAAKGLCATCGAKGSQVDHIVPVAEHGTWDRDNLQFLCKPCHLIKSKEDARRGKARRR